MNITAIFLVLSKEMTEPVEGSQRTASLNWRDCVRTQKQSAKPPPLPPAFCSGIRSGVALWPNGVIAHRAHCDSIPSSRSTSWALFLGAANGRGAHEPVALPGYLLHRRLPRLARVLRLLPPVQRGRGAARAGRGTILVRTEVGRESGSNRGGKRVWSEQRGRRRSAEYRTILSFF